MEFTAKRTTTRWSSWLAFVFASTAAAVGLGNIWRFRYITGQNGGGAFVLVYIAFILLLGIPLMMSEVMIGRHGRQNPTRAMSAMVHTSKHKKYWRIVGGTAILSGFLILSYYSVIAGWVLDYVLQVVANHFHHIDVQHSKKLFASLLTHPEKMILFNSSILLATAITIGAGIEKGLEKTVYFMIPTLIVLMLILVLYGAHSGGLKQSIHFLFFPNFSQLTAHSILLALGQSFFSLGIATGIIMTFGAYLPASTSITKTAVIVTLIDTGIALLAGLVVFPVVFAHHLAPGSGPGLIFETLPIAFGNIPFGRIFGTLFFIMLLIAAFTSAIALLEPTVFWLIQTRAWSRWGATLSATAVLWVLGLGVIASFNIAAHVKLLGLNFFELLDYTTASIMMPLGALMIAIFCGWVVPHRLSEESLQLRQTSCLYRCWQLTMRYVAPLAITVIFFTSL